MGLFWSCGPILWRKKEEMKNKKTCFVAQTDIQLMQHSIKTFVSEVHHDERYIVN